MGFKMKSFNSLLGLHPSSNKLDNVIKLVDLPTNKHWGYIDENKTIHVNRKLKPHQMLETIKHEKGHKRQMSLFGNDHEPQLQFNSLYYKWKANPGGKSLRISTNQINTKSRKLPWEQDADKTLKLKNEKT
tara:strand:- start:224 stop:616 length:393 start_codon:yes stop_codon:yes gene_type:complete